jgi:hypothetical protein
MGSSNKKKVYTEQIYKLILLTQSLPMFPFRTKVNFVVKLHLKQRVDKIPFNILADINRISPPHGSHLKTKEATPTPKKVLSIKEKYFH